MCEIRVGSESGGLPARLRVRRDLELCVGGLVRST